jgi:hypothetical protein
MLPGDVAVAEVCDLVAGVRVCVAPARGAELASFQVHACSHWPRGGVVVLELLSRAPYYLPRCFSFL